MIHEKFILNQVFNILSERAKKEAAFGHLPTGLGALDESLWGGIPFGVMTEIVGPAGIGKTQVVFRNLPLWVTRLMFVPFILEECEHFGVPTTIAFHGTL